MSDDRKVVEQVSDWLRMYDDGSIERPWAEVSNWMTGTDGWIGPSQYTLLAVRIPAQEHFIEGTATRDVVTTFQDAYLSVRIYIPYKTKHITDASHDKLPVILHFPSVGHCVGRADWGMYYEFYTKLVYASGAICVSVNLRSAPEHRLPAAVDDAYAALLWLRSVAQSESQESWLNDYADFSRVFLIGESSGGAIVHQVAARAGAEDLSPLKLVGAIPIHPGIHRSEKSKSELELPDTPMFTLDMMDRFLSLALPDGSTKDENSIICPMGQPMEGLNLPWFLLCVAENDQMIDREMEYRRAMKKAKKKVEFWISHGMGHCFHLTKPAIVVDEVTAEQIAQTEKLTERIAEFVKKH